MIDNANKDEVIEQYLMGEISGALLDEFKEKLDTDDQFRREVALQKAIIQNIRSAGRKEWALKLESIHSEINSGRDENAQATKNKTAIKSLKHFYTKKYISSVAAAIFLLIFSVLLWQITKRPDADQIFVSSFTPYPSLEADTRALPSDLFSHKDNTPYKNQNHALHPDLSAQKAEAFRFYKLGNYQESIRLFNDILAKEEDEEVLFYSGNAFLAVNSAKEAEGIFKKYLSRYTEFAVESKWYLSMSYLKQGKVKDAKRLLHELAQNSNDYSKKAKEALGKW